MNKQDIINIIEEYNTTQGGSKSSFTVPFHRHNGSDSPKILMGDLSYDQRGLIFPTNTGQAQIVITNGNTLSIAGFGRDSFSQIRTLFDTNYSTLIEENATSTSIITTGPSWFLRLPNNSVLPASPQVGDICIYNGILQVCESAGVWTPK